MTGVRMDDEHPIRTTPTAPTQPVMPASGPRRRAREFDHELAGVTPRRYCDVLLRAAGAVESGGVGLPPGMAEPIVLWFRAEAERMHRRLSLLGTGSTAAWNAANAVLEVVAAERERGEGWR